MKLKKIKKSFANLFAQTEGKVLDNWFFCGAEIKKIKQNKKKQKVRLILKTEWQNAIALPTNRQPEIPIQPVSEPVASIVQAAPTAPKSPEPNPETLLIQELNQTITQLQDEIQKLKHELENTTLILAAEKQTAQTQLGQKETIITESRKEIYELKQIINKYQYIEQYTPPKSTQEALLQFGQEKDLYEHEILSFTRKALNYALQNHTHEKSRYRHILEDILQANPLHPDLRADKEREIHKILNDYQRLDKPTRQAMMKFGFTISEQGAHYKFMFLQQSRYTYTASKTSSDMHAGKNFARVLSRLLF